MSSSTLSSHIIKSKDLNLLRVFGLLLQEGNLSRVAAILGLTQPAVSRSLMKLREEFGDAVDGELRKIGWNGILRRV